ncbi:MAG: 1-phosphofructokinase [Calditrichaeota bacterium]|nr:1-phosphofructokinase [Calditrichota bacterium]
MIYTVTLNPALDRTIWVKSIDYDDANRIDKEEKFAGGKGIDVSRVLMNLGVASRALGFLGGYAGMEVEGMLLLEGVYCDFTPIANETRTNVIVHVESTGVQMLLNARGPEIQPAELTAFFKKLESLSDARFVVFSGSLPPGLSPIIYARSIETVKKLGAQVVLDTDGENLRVGITGKPQMIKPNLHELSRLVGRDLQAMADVIAAAEDVRREGVETVLVSMGARGILLVDAKARLLAVPPKVKVVSTVGAGDSAVAGFLYGRLQGMPLEESLRFAVAAGTATTLQPGTAVATREGIEAILPKVEVRDV